MKKLLSFSIGLAVVSIILWLLILGTMQEKQEICERPKLQITFDDAYHSIFQIDEEEYNVPVNEIKQFEAYEFSIYHYTIWKHQGVEWVVKVDIDSAELTTKSLSLQDALSQMADKIKRLEPCMETEDTN